MTRDQEAILALTADNERLRGLLTECGNFIVLGVDEGCEPGACAECDMHRLRLRIDAALAGAAVQPTVVHGKIAVVDAAHQYDPLRAFAEGEAEGDCSYGDNCPPVARHYRCVSCKARLALVNADRVEALRELTRQSQELGLYDATTDPTKAAP